MTAGVGMITHPIALCAYVLALVFGLLAKMLNARRDKALDRQLFRLAVFVSVTALLGGLFLAWYQTARGGSGDAVSPAAASPRPAGTSPPSVTATQTSTGANSPNIQNTGGGSVTVQTGGSSADSSHSTSGNTAPQPREVKR